MNTRKLTQDEADFVRLYELVATVFGLDFASLWWVPDCLWLREMPTFRPRPEGAHPGLCIRSATSAGVFDPWPLLLGASAPGPIPVTGMSARDPSRIGYFGKVLRPGMFGANDFATFKGGDRSRSVRPNKFKPSLSETEEAELREFLLSKGLLSDS